jgi:hypothetical protein
MDTFADRISRERRLILDDLNLGMLFIDAAEIEIVDDTDIDRRLTVCVHAPADLSPTDMAALLCRFLHHRRIPSVEIERAHDRVHLRCRYELPASDWGIDVMAQSA